ncbi:MAG: glycosyltransferase [Burkholderiaceae bacterium]|nr:glycosyltransferase [Burkholderiaceae bacterium]
MTMAETNHPGERMSVIVLTHNRARELMRTLEMMVALPEKPNLVVVDNASHDNTAEQVRRYYPHVHVVSLDRNVGAAARNLGVQQVFTPYVAFCDDDTWWESGSLARATELLDAYPNVAVLSARILVGEDERLDPVCAAMANSPLESGRLPGKALFGFMAGASVFRREAFLKAGGYEPALFLGGEEGLLAIDLAARGWAMVYAPQLTVHHHPSPNRDARTRRKLLARNAIWVACLRLRWPTVLSASYRALLEAMRGGVFFATLFDTVPGIPWTLRNRRVVPASVDAMYRKTRL